MIKDIQIVAVFWSAPCDNGCVNYSPWGLLETSVNELQNLLYTQYASKDKLYETQDIKIREVNWFCFECGQECI